jgi:hypothetical protein
MKEGYRRRKKVWGDRSKKYKDESEVKEEREGIMIKRESKKEGRKGGK